jgi:hypothetical protein
MATIKLRRDTAANWTATNPVLAQGEQGYEIDTNKIKIGDGITEWNLLSYFGGSDYDQSLNTTDSPTFAGLTIPDNTLTISDTNGLQTVLEDKVTKVTSTDNAIVRFDGTDGTVQNSGVIIDDDGSLLVDQAGALYLGDMNSDGSWRINRSGSSLKIQFRSNGSWDDVQSFTASYIEIGTIYEFNNCGKTGHEGPSLVLCNEYYSTHPATNVELSGMTINGVQEWVVPATGTYRIEVAGARAGQAAYGGYASGAKMTGDVILTKDTVLCILIGQMGEDVSSEGSPGGGGTFIWDKSITSISQNPIIVAGGGGGGGDNSAFASVQEYQKGQIAELSIASGPYSVPALGNGGASTGDWAGGGGAGWKADGADRDAGGDNHGYGGKYPLSGGLGGNYTLGGYNTSSHRFGGFGGGGTNGYDFGGGGGGYTGGNAGHRSNPLAHGAGGGSFNTGSNQDNAVGANSGHGYAKITFLG